MKAIILAAGQGKRLRPLTDNLPKCLLEVGGHPIIDYQVRHLKKNGVTELVVVLGFEAEKLKDHLVQTFPDLLFIFIDNEDYGRTYPAFGLYLASKYLTEECLYLNADVIFHPDIIQKVISSPHTSTTAIRETEWEEEEVNVIIDKSTDSILEMGKHVSKDLSNGEFIGVTKIGSKFGNALTLVLEEFVQKEELKKFAADALNLTIQRGEKMHAIHTRNLPAIEIDTLDDLKEAEAKIQHIPWTT